MARGLAKLPTLKTRTQQTTVGSFKPRSAGIQTPYYAMSPEEQAQKNYEQTAQAVQSYGEDVNKAQDDRNIFEKALNLGQNQGFFGDVFEVLGRPSEVVKGAAMNANPFEGAWQGLTGQGHYSGEQVSEALGITNKNSPRWARTLAGFGMDLATDPLSYTNAPFEWAGKGIKGMAKKGYAMAASQLSKTAKGAAIVDKLGEAFNRMGAVSKSAFGLWKNEVYKDFKTNVLNKANSRAVATEHIARDLKSINNEINSFAERMHKNPAEFRDERQALGLAEDASIDDVKKAIHEDLFNALEQHRQNNLSKMQVWEKLSTPADENGAGRFLIANAGKEAEEQGNALVRTIREDYHKANGRMLGDSEVSFTNGFVNVSPEVAKFLRREVNMQMRIADRMKVFGIEGALEGALQTLKDNGSVTLNLMDPAERMIYEKVTRLTDGRGVANIGSGAAQISLTPSEVAQILNDGDIQQILQESKDFGNNIRRYQELENQKAALQQRILEIQRKNPSTKEIAKIDKKIQKYMDEHVEVQQELDKIEIEISKLQQEAELNKVAIGKYKGEKVYSGNKKIIVEKAQTLLKQLFEAMPGIRNYLTEEEMGQIFNDISVKKLRGAYGSEGYVRETNKIEIKIDTDLLNTSTGQLESTIMHEIIHALDNRIGNKLFLDTLGKKQLMGFIHPRGGALTVEDMVEGLKQGLGVTFVQYTDAYAEHNIRYKFLKELQMNKGGEWDKEISHLVDPGEIRSIDKLIGKPINSWTKQKIAEILEKYKTPKKKIDKILEIWDDAGGNADSKWVAIRRELYSDADYNISYDDLIEFKRTYRDEFFAAHDNYNELLNEWLDLQASYSNNEKLLEFYKNHKELYDDLINDYVNKYEHYMNVTPKDMENAKFSSRLIPPQFLEGDSKIVETIAKGIGSHGVSMSSGASGEWFSEMIAGILIKDKIGFKTMESKYKNFITKYVNDDLKMEFDASRTIEGEIEEFQKRGTALLKDQDSTLADLYEKKKGMEASMKEMDEQLAIIRGQKVTVDQARRDLAKKIKAQKGTIEEYAKKFGVDLTPESTEQDLLNAFQSDKTFVVQFTGPQAEAANQLGLLQKWMEWNDNKFYKVKMADPVLVGVSDKFESILNSLEGVKQQIYKTIGDTFAQTGTQLGNVLEKLNIDGYMRHVINTESTIYLEIERLKSINKFTAEKARKMIPTLGSNAKIFDQKWLGSVTDINKRLGIELFNSNPIESMAVLLNILPEHFEVTNLFQSAFDAGLIRTITEEEVHTLIQEVQKGMEQGLTRYEANRRAYEALLEDEFVLVDEQIVKQINQSFDFLQHGGAKTAELKALQDQIEQIAAGRGMVMHKGVINQIKQYGKSMSNRDLQVIMDNIKKYFVNPFKSLATLSAGFHIRNNITNITNAYLAGVKPTEFMTHFSRATRDITRIENQIIPKLQKMITSGEERIRTVAGQLEWIQEHLKPEELSLMNKMNEWQSKGVIGVNRYSKDLSELIRGINQGGGSKVMAGFKRVTEASMKLGKLSDDASKIAMYEWARTTKNGAKTLAQHGFKQPEQFSKFVFFDYSDLTAFEQRYMKAVFPFYTWARKNIEFQIKNFMKNTNRYIRLQKALSHWQSYMAGDEKDNLTQWDLEQMQIPVMNKNGKLTMLKVSPAFLDLADTAQHPLNKLSPLLKAPLEAFAGVNFFSGKKIDEGPLAEFGQSIFGDFGELGKAFRGQQYDKSKLGLVGGKMVAGKTAVESLVQGEATPSTLLPSVFRESDTQANRVMNINARTSRMRSYIQGLQRAGRTPTYATPGMRPRSRQQLFEMQQRNK